MFPILDVMRNIYFERNYSDAPSLPQDVEAFDLSESNAMYDEAKFVSFAYVGEMLPDGTKRKRLVGDIELCMSSSKSIRSVVSPDYQEKLRLGLLNQQKAAPRQGHHSDDDLIAGYVPNDLERDEIYNASKSLSESVKSRSNQSKVNESPQPEQQTDVETKSE